MTASTQPGKATPGPWEARDDRTIAAAGVPLLRCYAGRNEAANAHLIAAAPDLRDAAEFVEKCIAIGDQDDPVLPYQKQCLEKLRLALRKANGGRDE